MSSTVSIRFASDDLASLNEEASDYNLSLSDFLKQVIEQRHGKTIELSVSEASKLLSKQEGKIEVLTQQLADCQAKLTAATEKSGLNGVETKNQSVKSQIDEALLKERADQKLLRLEERVEELEEELEEAEKLRDEYKAQIDGHQRTQKMMEYANMTLETVGKIAPKPVEKIMNGLAGLFGGDDSGMGALNDPEQQLALQAGTAIMQEIDEANRPNVVSILQYFVANPKAITQILSTKSFSTWLNGQQPQS